MARKAINSDVKTARKLNSKPLSTLARVLVLIGKPFYLAVSILTIATLFVFYWTGHFTRKILFYPFNLFKNLKDLKIIFPRPRIKLRLPKLAKGKHKKLIYKAPKLRVTRKSFYFVTFTLLLLTSYWFFIVKDLPKPRDLVNRDQEVSTKIYDRNGVLLYNIYKDKNRSLVPLNEIPAEVRLATLAAEDAEFYQHPGFSIRGILRALVKNATQGELSGGSTITQQLVKNALLSSEKTIVRKVREIILALGVERSFSKDEILEMYLNEVSYGGTAYGIQEASRVYFGKDVQNLSLAEAALLAGLPKSPTKFSPFGPTPEEAVARQRDVLYLMRINKYITKEQEEDALEQRLSFAPNKIDIKAPHFVMFVRSALEEKYGIEVVEKGGLEVTTTLDYEIQKLAEEAVSAEVERLGNLNVGNGAALVLNPSTGEVLAMVGSKDYFDTASDGNVNVTTAQRQPGSSIKVVNYAYALGNGMTPASIINDSPVTFSIPGSEPYSPKNYDEGFRGNLTIRNALAESRNIPAVKVLASYGVDKMIQMGKDMGITTWEDSSRFGLSLTLGGGEIKLVDLAKVYATIANYGRRPELTSITKVTNYKGKVLEKDFCRQVGGFSKIVEKIVKPLFAAEAAGRSCEGEQVLEEAVAFQLIDILSDNTARSPAFGSYSLLVIPNHPEVAVKTGTSNNLRDNLAIGFSQEYLVATWVGNNDNSPMARVASGITGATPIFNSIMSSLLAQKDSVAWQPPDTVEKVAICTITGTLTCNGCQTKEEWFIKGTTPTTHCTSEAINKAKEKKQNKEGQITPEAASTNR